MSILAWTTLVALASLANATWYDTFTGNQITELRVEDLRANRLIPWCGIDVKDCEADERRRVDHTCNNLHYPVRGATLTPYHRMLSPDYAADGGLRPAKSGRPLPNARTLRVAILPDGRIPHKKYTHMVPNLNVFLVSDVTSVHDTFNYVAVTRTCCAPGGDQDPRCIPIYVADDDLHLRYSSVRCMNLTRAITYQRMGCVPRSIPGERINTSPPMLEMSNVYGAEEEFARTFRTFKGGRFFSEVLEGKEWPRSGTNVCINNDETRNETRCHNQGAAANALIGINMCFMWFFRNHNYLADKLSKINPCWSDERLYATAREINIAQYTHIAYYELMANIIGYDYLVKNNVLFPDHVHVDDYDPELEPRVSLEYVIGTRWFHTMQEGRLNLYDSKGKMYDQLKAVDLSLRTGLLAINNTLAGCTQGAFRQACASNDYVIDPEMGERVLTRLQFASDVASADIMKGRDQGLPSYNKYRELCKLPRVKNFKELQHWMPVDQVESITALYENIDDVELMTGLLAEYAMDGSVMGPSLACIMTEQLLRWRRADRFWYEHSKHPGAFTKEQLAEIKRTSTMSKLLCLHGDSVEAIQPNAFVLPGRGNEFQDCSRYPSIDFTLWKDPKCGIKSGPTGGSQYSENESFPNLASWWSI